MSSLFASPGESVESALRSSQWRPRLAQQPLQRALDFKVVITVESCLRMSSYMLRTAITETRREISAEATQELAGQIPEGKTVMAYDVWAVAD